MANAMIDGVEDVAAYTEVGIVCTSPNSGKKYYTPDVDESTKPNYALACGFTARKNAQYTKDGVVKLKYLVCTKEGCKTVKKVDTLNEDSQNTKVTRSKPSKRTGCQAQIRLELFEHNKFRIYKFVEEHNHPFVDEDDLHLLTAARSLTYQKEKMLCAMSNLNIGPVRAFNIMRTMYGGFENVGVTASDCKNFKNDINLYIGEHDADMVVRRLMRKKDFLPNFSCEYHTDDDGALKGLFWADEDSKRNYFTFGDVISFDATYRSNRYNMVFVPFTGIDNHNRNVTLGAALLGSETAESYKWLLQSFKKAFGVEPQVVVTDQDPAMKRAIEEVFTSSRHRLCMWHIMEKLAVKVGSNLCNNTDFKKRLCDIVWTDSITTEEFEREWVRIVNDFQLTDNNWLRDIFQIRDSWIPAYYSDENMSGLMRTTSRSESENHFLGQVCSAKSTLVEFLSHFETAMEAQRHEHRKNDHDTRYTNPAIWSNFVLEKQAAQVYTRTIFNDVQLEIQAACHKCVSAMYINVGDFLKFSIKDLTQPFAPFFEVMFRSEDVTASCSCKHFERFGLLCRHIFFVLRMCDIREFPKKYILRRWTREAVPNSSTRAISGREGGPVNNGDIDGVVRDIMFSTEYVINRLVTNMDQSSIFRTVVKEFMSRADACQVVAPPPSKTDRFAILTGLDKTTRPAVLQPIGIRNKGCGSHKRLKSKREEAITQAATKGRKCNKCKRTGHDSRNCHKFNPMVNPSDGASSSAVNTLTE